MARVSSRTLSCLLTFFLVAEIASLEENNIPTFFNIKLEQTRNITVHNGSYTNIVFQVSGKNIIPSMGIKITQKVSQIYAPCQESDFQYGNISEIRSDHKYGQYNLTVPHSVGGRIYFCLPHSSKDRLTGNNITEWYHQGPNVVITLNEIENQPPQENLIESRARRDDPTSPPEIGRIRIRAIRLEASNAYELDDDGVPNVLSGSEHTLRLFGEGFTNVMSIGFTKTNAEFGNPCARVQTDFFSILNGTLVSDTTVQVKVNIPSIPGNEPFYICVRNTPSSKDISYYQGTEPWLQIKTYDAFMPLWASILVIVICISFSSLFSGLNLGLMSMDKTELKILCNTGTAKERKYARVIQPVRNHGNYLLCSILLGNVLVNSIFTILLDGLTSGLIAVIFSTLAIVLFGEIFPQAVCSRHGLAIGAKTIYITKTVMVLTFPLSYSIAKFLDCVLGEEIGNVYTRERLKELVMVTTGENDLDKDEVNIISGALELRRKSVAEVMTKIEDVFMLDYEAVLDFETITEIMKSGYSRIPVYEGNRQNIVTMLYIKDLAFVDPDDNTPLKTLCQFYQNPCNFVFEDVTLDVMFKIFKEGNKGHMAFVSRVNSDGEGDPFYETIGLITLEDVIEELIQSEIVDETDVITDNRTKRRRKDQAERKDFTIFADKTDKNKVRMSPQLTLAAYQYLSTSVEPFQVNVISETILKRLLKQDIVCHIKKNKEWRTDPVTVIYSQGKAVDYFVIILEGRVEVTVGQENLVFEGGPFTYFGTQALVQTVGIESPAAPAGMGSLESLNIDSMLRHTFIPDYTVRASTEVLYLKIKRSLYLAAKRATLMEKSKRENQTKEQFDEEIDKLLDATEDDDISCGRITPRRKSSRNLQQNKSTQELINQNELQLQLSPKSPGHLSNASPPNRLTVKGGDVNGSLKSSPVDDDHHTMDSKGEEMSLLPKKS
ncbi:unextended protein isoform X2 [Anthonomus grandis grandis]|uniref:unextended protein isoform X2 n=1 Tax=Anthonomus grandis grandis TaxID=2921223 RepID=UPI002166A230|nr:unextended protein isoform X2 [Anthonomus grandis grandis]